MKRRFPIGLVATWVTLLLSVVNPCHAQVCDTLPQATQPTVTLEQPSVAFHLAQPVAAAITPQPERRNPYRFRAEQLVAPALLVGVGALGVGCDWAKRGNEAIRDALQHNHHRPLHFDNYLQYAPIAAPYALKACGLRGRHTYGEYTVLVATSYAILGISVNTVKWLVVEKRPDSDALNSFPSGHTATVFMGAELLRREYWDEQPIIGFVGYMVALGTAYMRLYNNRHWLTDTLAGAGIGILSVQAAYWLYPALTKALFPRLHQRNFYLAPTIGYRAAGVGCGISF